MQHTLEYMIWRYNSYQHMESLGLDNKTRLGSLKEKKELLLEQIPEYKDLFAEQSSNIFEETERIETDLTYLSPIQLKLEKQRQKKLAKEARLAKKALQQTTGGEGSGATKKGKQKGSAGAPKQAQILSSCSRLAEYENLITKIDKLIYMREDQTTELQNQQVGNQPNVPVVEE